MSGIPVSELIKFVQEHPVEYELPEERTPLQKKIEREIAMSHQIRHLDYHCSVSEKAILKDINSFAYDPQESSGYHGDLTFHKDPVYKNREEAMTAIAKFDRGWYNDHAVRYRDGRKIFWLVKCEWHC